MKIIFTLVLLVISIITNGQYTDYQSNDTTSLDTISLSSFNVIGIKPGLTHTYIQTDSSDYLTNMGFDPMFTLNREVPSVISQSDNGTPYGYSYMRMRGMDQTRINFTLNGIPMNEVEDQGIYFSNMPGFYNNINKMNITRGVGISKYGTTSLVGSVDMETKSSLNKEFVGQVGIGSFRTNSYNLSYSSGKIGRMSFSSNISYLKTDGFRERSGTDGYTYFGQIGYHTKRNTVKLIGFSGSSKNELSYIPVDKGSLCQNYRINFNSLSDKDKFNQNFYSINWINSSIVDFTINSSAYFNNVNGYYDVSFGDVARYGIKSNQGGIMTNIIYQRNNWTTNFGVNYNIYRRNHTLNYLDTLRYSNFGDKNDITIYNRSSYKFNNFLAFIDLQYRGVGFKYTDENGSNVNKSWRFFNPKVGIKRYKGDNESWVSLGRTSREVTRSDLFDGNDNIYINGGNYYSDYLGESNLNSFNVYQTIPNNTPEIVNNIEIGHKFKLHDVFLSSNLYYMDIRNERTVVGIDPISGLPIRQIVSNSFRTGFELDVRFRSNKWTLGSNGSFLRAEITKSPDKTGRTSFSPDFTMNNFIKYGRFSKIGINGMLVGRMYLDNTQDTNLSTDPYYIINITGEIPIGNVSINLLVNNLFNNRYLLPAGVLSGAGQYYPGSGRNYFLNLKFIID